jgi:cytochrome c oxidase subunit III
VGASGTEHGPKAATPERGRAAGRLGMSLFLVALGMLFAASMVGYLVVRLRAPAWPPAGSPRLPAGLWISTVILVTSSVTMYLASRAARQERPRALHRLLLATGSLGLAFLISQILNWVRLISGADLPAQSNLYAFTFYMLTGLHGAHVVGGLVPMGIVSVRAGRGRYTARSHEGVHLLSMYWHFLDVVWLVMFVLLVLVA